MCWQCALLVPSLTSHVHFIGDDSFTRIPGDETIKQPDNLFHYQSARCSHPPATTAAALLFRIISLVCCYIFNFLSHSFAKHPFTLYQPI
jgi:hypothetical protein